jgi:hypothetical protein
MSNLPVDRDANYMQSQWGTTRLITDYWTQPLIRQKEKTIHDLKKQTELHEMIRNDEDYDDWEYGTEPCYGKKV